MAKLIFGLDAGFGAFKIWGANGGNMVVSHVARADGDSIDFDSVGMSVGKNTASLISNGIGRYWVGLGATDIDEVSGRMDYERLSGSQEVRAMFMATLSKTNVTERDEVFLIVGVPFGFVSGEDADRRVAEMRSWMIGKHKWQDGRKDRSANVTGIKIVSQAQAAYLDYAMGNDGKQVEEVELDVGIVSIGHNTVELMSIDNGAPNRRFTRGDRYGVRRMLTNAAKSIGGGISEAEVDAMLRRGDVKSDYEDAIKNAKEGWIDDVIGFIDTVWSNDYTRFKKIIVVGGGVQFMPTQLRNKFKTKLVIQPDGVLSVARGLYKRGLTV